MLPWFAVLMTSAGILLAVLAAYVGWRRGSRAGLALAVLLAAVAWWGLAYAFELTAGEVATKSRWGDLKYLGITLLAPAWLVFVLQYTDRARHLSRRLVLALALEPLVVMVALLVPATHDLVHSYPPGAGGEALPVVGTGPVFWIHLVYANLMILVATVLFVVSMVRLSGTYLRMALVLVAAALLPWVVNFLHNFEVGWFASIDLTPFAFILTGGVLVWGLFRERLVRLTPLARGVVVESMSDGVFVLDAFGRVTDVNPAGTRLLGTSRSQLVGRALDDVLEGATHGFDPTASLIHLPVGDGGVRTHEIRTEPLRDPRGRDAGRLVILRDVTERLEAEATLHDLLTERSRVAAALQLSLVPGEMPRIPGTEMAGRYEPAGDGHEIGGDFFDIFPLEGHVWGVVLGDVSGKGAEAAAVTALTRYTLRALANARHAPSRTLRDLNARLLSATDVERHCTLVYALVRPGEGHLDVTLCLAGHHQPLITRDSGAIEAVGELGTALGLLEDAELHDTHVVLRPGDSVCLFTDGLVEARHERDLFGEERVTAILDRLRGGPLPSLADELVDAPRRFHGPRLADDLAVLLLRVEPAVHEVPA
jgi:serine phosphatase RsbU (regulator of sigma subunit)